ncbi:unnamed protein product [Ectocarpus sp. 6 AP-2014]
MAEVGQEYGMVPHAAAGNPAEEASKQDDKHSEEYVRPSTTTKLEVPEGGELLKDGTVRINVWASPRSLSTALMYSFAQRPDCVVYDEPLYAHFLRTHPEDETWRPYRDEVFREQARAWDSDGDRWIKEVALGPTPKPVVYMKHMAKQMRNLDLSFLPKCRNIIQIRTPIHMLPSWNTNIHANLKEIGMLDLLHMYSLVRAMGQEPIVIDAELLRANPEGVLREVSEMAGIPYAPEQLSWEAGPKPYDGCWAYVWYKGCRKSTCFDNSPRYVKFDQNLAPLLEECMPIYQLLRSKAITGFGKLGKVQRPLPAEAGSAARDAKAEGAAAANEGILVWVGGGLIPRDMAKVSVFDSSVQGGDAVWEGIRVYRGKIFCLDRHLRRLQDSAHALAFEAIPSPKDITVAIMATLVANDMVDGAHARVTLTRGTKTTSSMNPDFNVFGCTLIVLAERKEVGGAATYDNDLGVTLVTASNRRNPPQCLDSAIHHNNLLNNILPKIQANNAGAADAVMLDVEGFVSETNATNIFMAKGGKLLTPAAGSCLPGITRGLILELAAELGVLAEEKRVSLSELHCADEVFTTGTMGELSPVVKIDGRQIGGGQPGPLTSRLREAFAKMTDREELGTPLPTCA